MAPLQEDPSMLPTTTDATWHPRLGACAAGSGFRFEVWAPTHQRIELLLHPSSNRSRRVPLTARAEGAFAVTLADVKAGDRYAYFLDGKGPFPDPASRYQPEGVHGPSQIIDPSQFAWSDHGWRGVRLQEAVIYELHVGTFTIAGTFAGVMERLEHLSDLGITVVELMPVADFPGRWNWGYDGVSLFAPARCYGAPDDLRRLVDRAHRLGLAVILDVVYNHFGPDGAYSTVFSPFYLSSKHRTPWGAAVNLDGDHSHHVRSFFIENALHWLTEYHLDGLRLDATHGFVDDSACHFVRQLALSVRESINDRSVLLMAEDERNLNTIVLPFDEGGWGLDAVWSDDFHHQIRRLSAGDRDGYYQDFSGSIQDLAATLNRGWFYTGQHSEYLGKARGTDSTGVPLNRMVFCLQNHDQVGNRPFGSRLHHQIDPALFRAVTAVLLFAPETPLLFMGQEWAAGSPFLYFTDHNTELGRLVTEGRRKEFSRFAAFANEETRARIPDPQAESTFAASRLPWNEIDAAGHAVVRRLYQTLLTLRRREPALRSSQGAAVIALGDHSLAITRTSDAGEALLLIACFRAPATVDVRGWAAPDSDRWKVVLTTEDKGFVAMSEHESDKTLAPAIDVDGRATFQRPGAVVFRRL
jgi:maltooligosyltrehalose trehalohydrolase